MSLNKTHFFSISLNVRRKFIALINSIELGECNCIL